jgi:signal transduction histidine kinase/ActR/RegA family two-component response regulator
VTTPKENKKLEGRVLVLMPTGRDALLVCDSLESNSIRSRSCKDISELEARIGQGVGAVLIAEEVFTNGALGQLSRTLARQPLWSDVPVVLFASSGHNAERLLENVGTRFNATIVERPIRITMLVSAVRAALRARQRQYQTRDLLTQLEAADKQKDLFLATLSHELRTPLNAIVGWIPLLRRQINDRSHVSHGLDVIERNAKLQTELVSDILFLSRVITGKLELQTELLDLVAVVEAAIDDLRPTVRARALSLGFDSDADVIRLMGDPARLKQVFSNLLSNAVKFTDPGGTIDVGIRTAGPNVEIEIADNGRGIDPLFLPHVFERFSQADGSDTRGIGGLGLGLAIVRHLVSLHGGTIRAESEGSGRGASFIVALPAIAVSAGIEDALPPAPPLVDANAILKGLRVLLIEDDADSREMLSILFREYGLVVETVASGAEALEAFEPNTPDIIISDIGMPGENGYELIKRIRSLPAERGGAVPAIAVTGYVSRQDRTLALEAGYQEHVAKPVDIDHLIELIKVLMMKRKL